MRHGSAAWIGILACGLFACAGAASAQSASPAQPAAGSAAARGASLYENNCSSCHASGDARTPTLPQLRQRTPEAIVEALTTGAMRLQGADLADADRRAIAEYVSGRRLGDAASNQGRCGAPAGAIDLASGPLWNGWGGNLANTRMQPAQHARLSADQVPKLTLKWAFGFPDSGSAWAPPSIASGRLFVGSQRGIVYALDAKSGCEYWRFQAKGGVRTAVTLGPYRAADGTNGTAAYFGDLSANVYAIDARAGTLIWTRKIDDHPIARITGTPVLYRDRLYVPVSSIEEAQGGNARYECCTFRGSMAALDAATGAVVWKTYMMDEAKPIGKNKAGANRMGPSGASIWNAPAIDEKRRVLYAATGNMYTEPQQPTSDAVVALDLDTGKIAWTMQLEKKDVFVVGCNRPDAANCPDPDALGPDFDFGNSPIIAPLGGGREAIVIGQKSGIGWALDPDKKGAVLWQYRAGAGGALGGMEWGSAIDGDNAYFPVSDVTTPKPGGLHAVSLFTGERVWYSPTPPPACGTERGCNGALFAPATVIPGVVFAGSNDGAVRAHATKDGAVIWQFDTNRPFETVNGVAAKGASINSAAPIVVDGMVYVSSGYGSLGGRPGNVLLAFGVN